MNVTLVQISYVVSACLYINYQSQLKSHSIPNKWIVSFNMLPYVTMEWIQCDVCVKKQGIEQCKFLVQ